jgi:four helix bundle protein
MENQAEALKDRTEQFALRIIKVIRSLPACSEGRIIGHQLLRSGLSVAANYRAVCRARSRPEFLAKLAIVIEEADESDFLAGTVSRRRTGSGSQTEGSTIRGESTGCDFQCFPRYREEGFSINNQQSTILDKKVS